MRKKSPGVLRNSSQCSPNKTTNIWWRPCPEFFIHVTTKTPVYFCSFNFHSCFSFCFFSLSFTFSFCIFSYFFFHFCSRLFLFFLSSSIFFRTYHLSVLFCLHITLDNNKYLYFLWCFLNTRHLWQGDNLWHSLCFWTGRSFCNSLRNINLSAKILRLQLLNLKWSSVQYEDSGVFFEGADSETPLLQLLQCIHLHLSQLYSSLMGGLPNFSTKCGKND